MATRVVTLTPNGTDSNTFTVGGGAASAHAAVTDGSDTTYLESSTNGHLVDLALPTYTLQAGEFISGVKVRLRLQTGTDNQLIYCTLMTPGSAAVGAYKTFFGHAIELKSTGVIADLETPMFPGAGDPFDADAADRAVMGQTMLDGLFVRVAHFELAATASVSRVYEVEVDLYVSDKQPHIVQRAGRLHLSTGPEARLIGVNYRSEDFHAQTIETILDELEAHKEKGYNCFRLHLMTGAIKAQAGISDGMVPAQMGKVVEVLQWCNDNGCYVDLTLNAAYMGTYNPSWYEELAEADRWDEQRIVATWVAGIFKDHPALAYICLMNEGVVPTGAAASFWRAGDTDGNDDNLYVDRLVKDIGERTQTEVWEAWIDDVMSASDGVRFVNADVLVGCGQHAPYSLANGTGEGDYNGGLTAGEAFLYGMNILLPHLYPKTDQLWRGDMDEFLRVQRVGGMPIVSNEFYWHVTEGDSYHPEMAAALARMFHSFSGLLHHSTDGKVSTDYSGELTATQILHQKDKRFFEAWVDLFRRYMRRRRVGYRRYRPRIGSRT